MPLFTGDSELQPGAELCPTSQYDDRPEMAEEGRLAATPLLQMSDRPVAGDAPVPAPGPTQPIQWSTRSAASSSSADVVLGIRGALTRPRANANADRDSISRESTTSTEAALLIGIAPDGTAPENPRAARGFSPEANFRDPDGNQLPTLAVRLLGRDFPESVEIWPAAATTQAWRLQYVAIFMLALLSLGFILVLAAFVRGLEAWQSTAGQPCKPPLRWWLIGHISILALGILGCCSGMAFLGLAGWIAWGTALLQRRQASKCPKELVQAVQEAMSFELMLFGLVLLVACLAGFAARTVRKIHMLCHHHDAPWDPEAHLEYEDPERVDIELRERSERSEAGQSPSGAVASSDRECVICCDELAGNEVIARARCNHRFHKECILEWLRNHRTCPLCRHRIDKPLGWRPTSVFARSSAAPQELDALRDSLDAQRQQLQTLRADVERARTQVQEAREGGIAPAE